MTKIESSKQQIVSSETKRLLSQYDADICVEIAIKIIAESNKTKESKNHTFVCYSPSVDNYGYHYDVVNYTSQFPTGTTIA